MQVRTASVVTLGCKLNQAESYQLQVDLARAGVEVRPFGEPVDLSVVNTCTVTQVADQQARQLLRRAARFSPGGYVVAMGCYAQVAAEEVARVEGVHLVLSSGKEYLVQQLEAAGLALGPGRAWPSPGRAIRRGRPLSEGEASSPDYRVPLPATRVRQFVKVQDGCDDYCTYCIVPFARGHSFSRPPDAVVAEVQELVERGCREVVLTGVQIGAYGRDRYRLRGRAGPAAGGENQPSGPLLAVGPADPGSPWPARGRPLPLPGAPLAALVRRLLEETQVGRIRISSIQPQDWADDFFELFANPRLCRHLHLPLQAGCDATLRRMSRRYTTADFARLVERLRSKVPDVAITADMIVGFPGETDRDHRESVNFARRMDFAGLHVFRYSPRSGTAASRMAGQVSADVKKLRGGELRSLADEMAQAFRRRFVGQRAWVLWEESLPPDRRGRQGRQPGGSAGPTAMGGPEAWFSPGAPGPAWPLRLQAQSGWTGLTDNYLRVVVESEAELLGEETAVTLEALEGETFRGSLHAGG